MANTFGEYIRLARIEKGVGQRELARQLGVSLSYLNDIEQAKRSAPLRFAQINKRAFKH